MTEFECPNPECPAEGIKVSKSGATCNLCNWQFAPSAFDIGVPAEERCWNCGSEEIYADSGVCSDPICLKAKQNSEARWDAVEQTRRSLGLRTSQAREARRNGLQGKVAQEGQLKRDAGYKMIWISPEEYEVIQAMRADTRNINLILTRFMEGE